MLPAEVPSEEVRFETSMSLPQASDEAHAPDAAYLVSQEVPSQEALSQDDALSMSEEVSDDVPPQGVSSQEVPPEDMPCEEVPLQAAVVSTMMMLATHYQHRGSTVLHSAAMMTTPTNCLCRATFSPSIQSLCLSWYTTAKQKLAGWQPKPTATAWW